ncbi:hypothetical protein [Heyndrickxia sporothermodurans]|nr:hypothetical protein JGZ69_13260 [Heyndrickxia sporothermodurans]
MIIKEGTITLNHNYPNYPMYPPNPYQPYPFSYSRQYQPVNPSLFIQSANKTLVILKDAEKIVEKISKSEDFSKRLMTFAQQSKLNEVKKMISSIGVKTIPIIRFTPSGLVLNFSNSKSEPNCCLLQLKIRWGQ